MLYVSDWFNDRIQVFNKSGEYLFEWNGSEGVGGNIYSPRGIVVDIENYVYVCDYGNRRVVKYDETGNYILQWGTPPELIAPFGICTGTNGYLYIIYISDYSIHNVQVITNTGEKIDEWGEYGSGDGQFNSPSALESKSNKLYVVDTVNHRIQVFNMEGNYIMSFGSYGTGDGELNYPRGIAIGSCYECEETPASVSSDLSASSSNFKKTQVTEEFNENTVYSYPNPAKDKSIIRFPIKETQEIKISIYDLKGNIVWQKQINRNETRNGINEITWDCKNEIGKDIANGIYLLKISAEKKTIIKKIAVIR